MSALAQGEGAQSLAASSGKKPNILVIMGDAVMEKMIAPQANK